MTFLAESFGMWVLLAALVVAGFLFSLGNKISRGSNGAGPQEAAPAPVTGLTAAGWDLEAIDSYLTSSPDVVAAFLRELADSVGVDHAADVRRRGPDEVERLLLALEGHLQPPGLASGGIQHSLPAADGVGEGGAHGS